MRLPGVDRFLPATPAERAAALWSFAYFFTLLAGYYVLRPLRDQMGIAGGVKALPWLFTATFVTLLVAQPIYGALVARLPRTRFIPIVYHFFALNLALFWLLLTLRIETTLVARVFFVWVSVFNLFAVAVFWSFMADLFTSEQGKRLFGFIGAGGTLGALLGPVITIGLSVPLGPANLLIAAIVFLELAVLCSHRLERAAAAHPESRARERRVGGGAFAALPELLRSPYLLGVGAWVSLLSFGATMLYFEQANVVHMGDLLWLQFHPRVDRPAGASIQNWLKTLETIAREMPRDTIYIGGHARQGLPVTADVKDVAAFRDYFDAVLTTTRKGIAERKSKEEITASTLPQFASYQTAGAALSLAGVLGVAYDELTAR